MPQRGDDTGGGAVAASAATPLALAALLAMAGITLVTLGSQTHLPPAPAALTVAPSSDGRPTADAGPTTDARPTIHARPWVTITPPSPSTPAASGTPASPSPHAAAPTTSVAIPTPTPAITPLDGSIPTHLDIVAIDVHTPLIPLGLNSDGTVEVPPLTRRAPAGWYRHLASPGEDGAAVLLGHVDSAREGPAVFYRLGELGAGDTISVTRADGSIAVFRVDSVRLYPKQHFPTQAVYGDVDHPTLRLVTCGGTFDRARGTYRDNVIVFATLIATVPAHP